MNGGEFRNYVLQRFFQDIHKIEPDNYAAERFSFDGVDRSMVFDVNKHVLYFDWFMDNYDAVFEAYERFADQASKDLFVDVIRYRLAGHLHVRMNARVWALADEVRRFKSRFAGVPSTLAATGMFGSLVHYDAEWEGVSYAVDTLKDSLLYYLVHRQYFFDRDGTTIKPDPGDHLIDGGSFTGDSGIVFSRAVGPQGRVYSFDPVQNHVDICNANFARAGYENMRVFPYGVSDKTVAAPTVKLGQYSPGWRVDDSAVPLIRIDDLVIAGQIERIDFIKLDVEGSETAALRGALASIHKFKPKLAISIYHRPDDLFGISKFVDDLRLGYKFYLDCYTIYDEEIVLYAKVA